MHVALNLLPWNATDIKHQIESSRWHFYSDAFEFKKYCKYLFILNYPSPTCLFHISQRQDFFFFLMVHPTLNFWQLIPGQKIIINKSQDKIMMKNKSKKQEDEGSTQSNASRYDLSYFSLFFNMCLDCLPLQAWLITCAEV